MLDAMVTTRFSNRIRGRFGAFPWDRVVLPAMRRIALLTLLSAACTRPVLYYPAPSPAVAPEEPAATPAATPAAMPSLATIGGNAAAVVAGSEADLRQRHILVPVAGADMSRVADSFNEPRDGERVHRAIDILAPRGTPILAADAGTILRMTTTKLGGISLYAVDTAAHFVYYYAHMDRYHDAMAPGRAILRGDTLGFVGTTGNAPKNTPHLHFQVMRWPADGKYWNAEPINPFLALGGVPRERGRAGAGQPRSR